MEWLQQTGQGLQIIERHPANKPLLYAKQWLVLAGECLGLTGLAELVCARGGVLKLRKESIDVP
jgi:hypothetical protein